MIKMLQVVTADPTSGLIDRMISYEFDDLDAAYAELDRLYAESQDGGR